jgi:predicted ester cyclase
MACLYEFEEDQLVHERVYFDFAGIMRQLGVLPS